MKKISTFLLAISCLLIGGAAQAQTNSQEQFVYNCGVMTGYEFEDRKIPYDRMPTKSIVKGIKGYLDGNGNMTEADAGKVVQTIGDKIEASKTSSGYNYDNFDFSSIGYSYGVLIGSNWKTYGVQASKSNSDAFLKGIKAVFYDREAVGSRAEAQEIIMQKAKEFEAEKIAIKNRDNRAFMEYNRTNSKVQVLENSVQYEVLKDIEGTPIGATSKRLKIQYIGKLKDGTIFEDYSSKPIIVTQSSVRAGMCSVLKIMRENQTIKAYIPPSLGYGNQKNGDVPASSILIYEITLLEVLD